MVGFLGFWALFFLVFGVLGFFWGLLGFLGFFWAFGVLGFRVWGLGFGVGFGV